MNTTSEIEVLAGLADAEKWEEVIRFLPDNVKDESDTAVLGIAGRAYSAVGRSPYNIKQLQFAVDCLMTVWNRGSISPKITWPLVKTLYELGRQEDCVLVLERYIEITDDANE